MRIRWIALFLLFPLIPLSRGTAYMASGGYMRTTSLSSRGFHKLPLSLLAALRALVPFKPISPPHHLIPHTALPRKPSHQVHHLFLPRAKPHLTCLYPYVKWNLLCSFLDQSCIPNTSDPCREGSSFRLSQLHLISTQSLLPRTTGCRLSLIPCPKAFIGSTSRAHGGAKHRMPWFVDLSHDTLKRPLTTVT